MSRSTTVLGTRASSVVARFQGQHLQQRGLIEEAGEEHEGQSTLFRTTPYFLERMGMKSLEELPEIAEHLPRLETLTDIDASL